MSFDEITEYLRAKNEQKQAEWERERWTWFFIMTSQGGKYSLPEDLMKFEWEVNRKLKPDEINTGRIKKGAERAERYYSKINGKRR